MKFSVSWLKDYLDFDCSVEDLCGKLTAIGLEVEECVDESESLSDFSVAKILEAQKHENSDKLSICKVENGTGEILQIVCGAKNARTGIKVALASIGSVIPTNKMVIKKAKVAGVESCGMLCSASELGLGKDGEGIIEIDEKWPVGAKIAEVFGKNDAVIDVNITPNRGDCLGVFGIARDLSASGFGKLKPLKIKETKSEFSSKINAKITASEACGVILLREIKGVKNCNSPQWLKSRLESIGQSSISAIVDVTNYVMFCLNRPMHAYDAAKIDGEIEVRFAKKDEEFTSLKDLSYKLDEEILTIADDKKILGIAGVIGSKESSCNDETCDIILEAAFFDKVAVALSSRKLNILSDAKYRFERGVDFKTCQEGIEFATALILEICGGVAGDVKVLHSDKFNEKAKKIDFDLNKIKKLIGLEVPFDKVFEILNNLGFACEKKSENNFLVEIPSHRSDVEGACDLIEEVVRIYGYDKIPSEKIDFNLVKPSVYALDKVRQGLISSGMVENINWSFCDLEIAKNFTEIKPELTLLNPISENLNYMRPSLLVGLMQSYKKNYLRGNFDISAFEIGKVFFGVDEKLQKLMISGIRAGKNQEQSHYNNHRDFDIFDVKKDAFEIFEIFGLQEKSIQIDDSNAPIYYHPHRFAALKLGKNLVGYFGEIHPKIAKIFDIKANVNVFEIFVDVLPNKAFENFEIDKKPFESNDLQPILRDFAFLIDSDKKIGELTKIIQNCDKNLIKQVDIFDIYQGKNIEEGKKSVALRVVIQPILQSMKSDEIELLAQKIINIVEKNGGILRK